MTLSALIKKGGLSRATTATSATIATQEEDEAVTVAPVATVAVASNTEQLPDLNNKYELSKLSADDELKIRNWLDFIEETDEDIITEVIEKCRIRQDARQYYLGRAKEVINNT